MNWRDGFENCRHWIELRKAWVYPCALGLAGTLFLYVGLRRYKTRLGYGMATQIVLRTVTEVPEGQLLTQADLSTIGIPARLAPLGVIRATEIRSVVGRTAFRPIGKGAMLLWADLEESFVAEGPARKITKGYRALSVPTDAVAGVGHSIRAGDHVDIVTTARVSPQEGDTAFTLLQNVAVLDVGEGGRDNEERYSTVTLMVLPREVGIITYAEQHGKLTFVLRNPEDFETRNDLPMVGSSQVIESGFRNSLQEERNRQVEVIRGGLDTYDSASP